MLDGATYAMHVEDEHHDDTVLLLNLLRAASTPQHLSREARMQASVGSTRRAE